MTGTVRIEQQQHIAALQRDAAQRAAADADLHAPIEDNGHAGYRRAVHRLAATKIALKRPPSRTGQQLIQRRPIAGDLKRSDQ